MTKLLGWSLVSNYDMVLDDHVIIVISIHGPFVLCFKWPIMNGSDQIVKVFSIVLTYVRIGYLKTEVEKCLKWSFQESTIF